MWRDLGWVGCGGLRGRRGLLAKLGDSLDFGGPGCGLRGGCLRSGRAADRRVRGKVGRFVPEYDAVLMQGCFKPPHTRGKLAHLGFKSGRIVRLHRRLLYRRGEGNTRGERRFWGPKRFRLGVA